jgi:hypothetical protein
MCRSRSDLTPQRRGAEFSCAEGTFIHGMDHPDVMRSGRSQYLADSTYQAVRSITENWDDDIVTECSILAFDGYYSGA